MCRFTPNSLKIVGNAPLVTAALDPHYHQLRTLSDRHRSLVHRALKEKLEAIHSQEESQKTAETEEREPAPKKRKSAMSGEDETTAVPGGEEEVKRFLRAAADMLIFLNKNLPSSWNVLLSCLYTLIVFDAVHFVLVITPYKHHIPYTRYQILAL